MTTLIKSSFSALEESEIAHKAYPWVTQAAKEFPLWQGGRDLYIFFLLDGKGGERCAGWEQKTIPVSLWGCDRGRVVRMQPTDAVI